MVKDNEDNEPTLYQDDGLPHIYETGIDDDAVGSEQGKLDALTWPPEEISYDVHEHGDGTATRIVLFDVDPDEPNLADTLLRWLGWHEIDRVGIEYSTPSVTVRRMTGGAVASVTQHYMIA